MLISLSLNFFKITIYLISSHIYYEYVFPFVFVLLVFSNSVVVLIHLITDQAPKECSRFLGLGGWTGGFQG